MDPPAVEPDRTGDRRGRQAALTIGIVLSSLVAVAVGLRLAQEQSPVAHRVVVGAQGCGGDCDAQLARSLADNLRKVGFDAVAPGRGKQQLGGPEGVRAFAREHAARFAVMIVVAVEDRTALAGTDVTRVNANASVYVMDAEEDTAPSPAFMLRSVDEGSDERTALQLLGHRFLGALFPMTASALLSSAPVEALQAGADSMEQQAAALAMKRHSKNLGARALAMQQYQRHCAENERRLHAQRGEICVSKGCAEEYVVGVLPDGSAAVVHDSSNTAVFPLSSDSTARSFPTAERLWLVPRQGQRRLLAEASNFYSQPSLSRDGTTLAYVERRHGRSRLYAGPVERRERPLLAEASLPMRLSSPQLSDDGSGLLFFEVEQDSGRAALKLVQLDAEAPIRELLPHAVDARWVRLAPSADEAPRELIAVLAPAAQDPAEPVGEFDPRDRPGPQLSLLDPASGSTLVRAEPPVHRIKALGDVDDDVLILGYDDDPGPCGFARYTPGRPFEWTQTSLCPKYIAASPQGVFAHALVGGPRPSRQIVRIDAKTGTVTPLTNSLDDLQRPRPAAQRGILAYERVLPRKYGEFQHVAVCFTDVGEAAAQ